MTAEQQKALETLGAVVNAAVQRGLFDTAQAVIVANNAMVTITAGLESKEQPKS